MLWKQMKESSNYEISEYGDIRSLKTGNILKPDTRRDYDSIGLCTNGKRKVYFIHRLVASNFLPDPTPEQLAWASSTHWGVVQVNHKDYIKKNNHYTNLEWVTGNENINHSYSGVRSKKGSGETHTILTEEQKNTIRNTHIRGDKVYGTKALCKRFNVSKDTILKYLKK